MTNKLALTVREACQLSGLSRSTIYELFADKRLTPKKCGRRTLVLADELRRFLENLPTAA